jgi:hypothetical protein
MDNPVFEAAAPAQGSIRRPQTSGNYEGPFRTSTTTLPDGRLRERRFRLDGTLASERVFQPTTTVSRLGLDTPLPPIEEHVISAAHRQYHRSIDVDEGWLTRPSKGVEIIADGAGAARKVSSEELEDREAGFDVFDTIDDIGLGLPRKLDVAVNEALGGQPGQTISARVAPREGPLQSMIADGLDFVAPGHTARALDAEYATRGVNPCAPKLSAREVSKLARELCLGR